MFRLIICAVFVSTALAIPSLIVGVSGPSSVTKIDDVKITTSLTNVGDETLKILNDPRSPLTHMPTDIFSIANEHGTAPDFVGVEAKYVPSTALASGDSSAYTVLAPGQSVHIEHAIAEAYDFTTSGPGQYTIILKTFNAFYHTTETRLFTLIAGRGHPFHTINITGLLSPTFRPGPPQVEDCDDWQIHSIQGAIPVAQKYIASALSELAREGSTGAEYKRWFGAPSEIRLSTVVSHFEALNGNNYSDYTYACNTEFCLSRPGVYAYVYPHRFGQMHICEQFFRAPVGGRDSRASTIVHESSHFTRNGGTEDHAYGERLAQELAQNYPQMAVMNADNHEYYAAGAHGDDAVEGIVFSQTYFGDEVLAA